MKPLKEVLKCKSPKGNISVVCSRIKSIAVLRFFASHNNKCVKVPANVD